MAKVEITYELAMAAGHDAGNRSMREGRRTKWAVKDWNAAYETFERLVRYQATATVQKRH